jgi:phage terminase Nu1 subunit (DNA packaging protein)
LDVDEYRYDKRAPKNISEIDGETYDKTVEEARLKHHQANNEALKEAETVGQILNAGYVVEMCGAIVANARARMLVIHNTIKNRFPEADQEIIDETERAIIEALNELGKDGVPDSLRKSMDKYSGDMDGPA